MKTHSVALIPSDGRDLKMILKIIAPDKKAAEEKALKYVEREFAPLKYKLAAK